MFCSSIFTFSGNKPWCPRTLSFALNLRLLSHRFLTCMFVLLVNPLLYIVIHSLGVRKSVFYHVITISTKKKKNKTISELWLTQQPLFGDKFSAIPQEQNASTYVGQGLALQSLADQYELGLLTIQMSFPRQDGQGSSLLVPGLKESIFKICSHQWPQK